MTPSENLADALPRTPPRNGQLHVKIATPPQEILLTTWSDGTQAGKHDLEKKNRVRPNHTGNLKSKLLLIPAAMKYELPGFDPP